MKIYITTNAQHYFKCIKCGLCCEGPVELTKDEYKRILKLAVEKGLTLNIDVKQSSLGELKYIMKPIELDDFNRKCTFLIEKESERICSIYNQRPCFCRLYPLFIGYSKLLNSIYVDFLHCPGISHNEIPEFEKIDNNYISSLINHVLEIERNFLKIVPNLDRAVIAFRLPTGTIALMLPIKYDIVRILNNSILTILNQCDTYLDLLHKVLALQEEVKKIIYRCKEVEKCIEDLVYGVEIKETNVKVLDVWKIIRNRISLLGIDFSDKLCILFDHVNKTFHKISIEFQNLKKEINNEIRLYVSELLTRFPANYQTLYLPFENLYINGYFMLILLTWLYDLVIEEPIHVMSNVDSIGLAMYYRYILKLIQEMKLYHMWLTT